MLVSSVNEPVSGVESLYKSGAAAGNKDHPNFGKYLPKEEFKAFIYYLTYLWANEKYWFQDRDSLPWEFFKPFLGAFNALRGELLYVMFLILDESMSGWRPKTPVTGGLPNITFEPCKPVNLGSMLCNAVECFSGILSFQDPVEDLTSQRLRKYFCKTTQRHGCPMSVT